LLTNIKNRTESKVVVMVGGVYSHSDCGKLVALKLETQELISEDESQKEVTHTLYLRGDF